MNAKPGDGPNRASAGDKPRNEAEQIRGKADQRLRDYLDGRPPPEVPLIAAQFFWPDMVPIDRGTYWLGAPGKQFEWRLAHDLYVSRYPITIGQFRAILPTHHVFIKYGQKVKELGRKGIDADNFPMVYVNWDDAVEYCHALTESVNQRRQQFGLPALSGKFRFRLPSKEEWEVCARAGGRTCFSVDPTSLPPDGYTDVLEPDWAHYNWTVAIDGGGSLPYKATDAVSVYHLKPNKWGVAGCHGNVGELAGCRESDSVCIKGGHYRDRPQDIASHAEQYRYKSSRNVLTGFRVVRMIDI
jgi:formylglycine-generating enzyme required for sulfatase activity